MSCFVFFFKQKTAYEMRISDWSSDVCSSDLEIHRSGCNGGACHAQMYTMGTLLKHGSEAQKQAYLPAIARGELRLQAFGVTEPTAGTDTDRKSTRLNSSH